MQSLTAAPVPELVPEIVAARDNVRHALPDRRPQLLHLCLYLCLMYLNLQLSETIQDVLYLTTVLNCCACKFICTP